MSNEARKRAEAYSLSRTDTALLGKPLSVKWIPEGKDDLGYTSGVEHAVYVAWDHKYFYGMSDSEKTLMRMGVNAHELLHQIFTAFSYTNFLCKDMSQFEAKVFMMFANTLEDAAIEYQAPNAFTGLMLEALRYSILTIYQKTPPLDESKDAFSQLVNALIQFGDMAIIKGNFTFPESYEYFKKVAPLYNKGIVEPNGEKRLDIAKECMEITRPLWEPMIKEQEDFMKFIEELLKEFASEMEDAGLNLEGLFEPGEGGEPEKSDRRSEMLEKMSGSSEDGAESEDSEESKEEGDGSGKDGDKDDSSDSKSSGSGASTDMGTESDKDTKSSASDGGKSKKKSGKSNPSSSSSSADSGSSDDSDSASGKCKPNSSSITTSPKEANEMAEIEKEVGEELLKEVEENISRAAKELESEADVESEVKDYEISSPRFKHASCLNRKIKVTSPERYVADYKRYLMPIQSQIDVFSKSLMRLLKDDTGEMQRRTSGKYNIRRGEIGCSAKIFDKRKLPGDPHDIAVTIIVDESGSMGRGKMEQARKACVILTEAFAKVKIPVYVLGFRADDSGYDAVHDVYVGWKNTLSERSSLMSMTAGGNNFDGYSVRYGGKVLNDSGAVRQILFVISDGQPACCKYAGDGVADTSDAIREVRKSGAIVFGIGIGYCGPDVLMGMYGKDFIHCADENLLASTIEKRLKKILKAA